VSETIRDERYWSERREYPRFDTELYCSLREGVAHDLTAVMMRNLSLGGCFVLSDQPLPEQSRVQLHLELPELDRRVVITAEVAWQKLGGFGSGMGVRFLEIASDDLDVLRIYLRELAKESELET
jgi:Tfp pilus assembly protein PilZ